MPPGDLQTSELPVAQHGFEYTNDYMSQQWQPRLEGCFFKKIAIGCLMYDIGQIKNGIGYLTSDIGYIYIYIIYMYIYIYIK